MYKPIFQPFTANLKVLYDNVGIINIIMGTTSDGSHPVYWKMEPHPNLKYKYNIRLAQFNWP